VRTKTIKWLTRNKPLSSFLIGVTRKISKIDKLTVEKGLRNKAVVRPKWNRYEQKELRKIYQKLIQNWIAFWDVATDYNPKWCFVSGRYIPPRYRGDTAVKPFKNGEWCYKYDYDRYLDYTVMEQRLSENSKLICIWDRSDVVKPNVLRPKCLNNKKGILSLPFDYPLNLDWKQIRSMYFLKPSGKPFPRL